MGTVEDALETQARNIEKATGRSVDEWAALVTAAGIERHAEMIAWLKAEHSFSHGNANRVAVTARRGPAAGGDDKMVDAMYGRHPDRQGPCFDHSGEHRAIW